jgi:uncharacterized protein (TIGR02996 family)
MNIAVLRAFLDDIKAHPFDNAPRLILADWLQEHGDTEPDRARGQFLALCASSEMELPEEAAALLAEYGGAWLGSLPECPGVTASCHGGLIHLTASAGGFLTPQLGDFASSPAWDWVSGMTLTGEDPYVWQIWRRPWLESLSHLRLACAWKSNSLRLDVSLRSPHLGNLRRLDLTEQSLSLDSVRALAAWPGLGRLQGLSLTRNFLGSSGAEALAGAPSLAELRVLDLAKCAIGSLGLESLARRGYFGCLRWLYLAANHIDPWGLATLAGSALLPDLECLDLSDNDLREGVRILAELALPALRELSLRKCWLGAKAAASLARAPWLHQLKVLNLEANLLGDAGVRVLLASDQCNRSTRLLLRDNMLSPGVRAEVRASGSVEF